MEEKKQILQEFVAEMEKVFATSLKKIILYGSYARGDYDDESDVDIMIMVDMSREELSKYRTPFSEFFSDINLEKGVF